MQRDDEYPSALVRVVVNVDNLRKGYEAEVELTPRILALVSSGYIVVLGHVAPPAAPLPVAPPAPALRPSVAEPEPVAAVENVSSNRPARRKKTATEVTPDASGEGGS